MSTLNTSYVNDESLFNLGNTDFNTIRYSYNSTTKKDFAYFIARSAFTSFAVAFSFSLLKYELPLSMIIASAVASAAFPLITDKTKNVATTTYNLLTAVFNKDLIHGMTLGFVLSHIYNLLRDSVFEEDGELASFMLLEDGEN